MAIHFIGRHLFDSYILSPIDLLPLRQTSRDYLCIPESRNFFQHYLQQYENSIGTVPFQPTWNLFREFHAAILQKRFLRKALQVFRAQPHTHACIAGSYGTFQEILATRGACSWAPGDIDIFIAHENEEKNTADLLFEQVIQLYTDYVANPLELRIRKRFAYHYLYPSNADPDSSDAPDGEFLTREVLVNEDTLSSHSNATETRIEQETKPRCVPMLTRSMLEESIHS